MMFNEFYRMVRQVCISLEDYVFIRLESLDAKARETIFVYVSM